MAQQPQVMMIVTEVPREPFDLVEAEVRIRQEWTRTYLAFFLAIVLAAVLLLAAYAALPGWDETQEYLQIALPAVLGIFGTVIGFYFGTEATGGTNGGAA